MSDTLEVAGVVSDIYDAALDSCSWPQVLRRTMAVVGGVSAAILSHSTRLADSFHCSVGMDPHYLAVYLAHYAQVNPLVPFEESLPAGTVFCASDAMPYEALRATPFFNEWAKPQGIADFIGIIVEKSPSRLVKLMVNRHERRGPIDGPARRAMEALAPHFRRAFAISKALERGESKRAALSDVLDRLSTAVVFVDQTGGLLYANSAAAQLLAASEVFRWEGGRLRPTCDRAAAHLQAILASSSRGQPGQGCAARFVHRGARGAERLSIHVLPIAAGSRRHAFAPRAATAAVLVSHCASDLTQRVQSAARFFAFTPAETRVVQALMSGGTIRSVAGSLGIVEATVKTHLQHVFDKTSTRRRVDLVGLIAGWEDPPLDVPADAGGEVMCSAKAR